MTLLPRRRAANVSQRVKRSGPEKLQGCTENSDIWVGINRLRQILPRFSFRIPACERLIEALSNYHTVRASSTGLALDEPVHDWASHFGDSCRVVAEAEAAGMLHSAGSTANVFRRPVTVRAGFRGDNFQEEPEDILDRFFGSPKRRVRVIR